TRCCLASVVSTSSFCCSLLFFFTLLPPPRSTLFPYTTLFRSLSAALGHPFPRRAMWRGCGLGWCVVANISLPACGFSNPVGNEIDRKSTRLNSSHGSISYAVFCLKKKKQRTARDKTILVIAPK